MIRPARPDDVDGIATVHARAWQAAYPAIMPARTLEAFTVSSRRQYWSGVKLDDRPPDRPIFVALARDAVVGFAVCGPPREAGMPFDAELYVLNVDPNHWRRGIGRRLFVHCVDHLISGGGRSLYLWVLAANERARRFYESLAGEPMENRVRDADFDGISISEIPYGWQRLAIIPVAACRD